MHADHFIWSSYGTWIPSCPRESWSRYIRSWERSRPGLIDSQEEQLAGTDPYRVNRMQADKTLKFPPIQFSALQTQAIAEGFQRCVNSRQAYVWACCIMPEYVQMLVTCPRTPATQLVGLMRSEATKRLNELDLHPLRIYSESDTGVPQMWSHAKWHLPLKDDDTVRDAIEYITQLPEREGLPGQNWASSDRLTDSTVAAKRVKSMRVMRPSEV